VRPRLAGRDALSLEITGERRRSLRLDAGRSTAGLYLLPRETTRRLAAGAEDEAGGKPRQAILHFRRYLDGARLSRLERVRGERTVVLSFGRAGVMLVLRLGGPAPALTLAHADAARATLGEGPPAFPPPPPALEWDTLAPSDFEAAVGSALEDGRSRTRAVLAACPGLGSVLARETDGSAASFAALRARLADARPTLLVPAPPSSWHDAELVAPEAVTLAPLPVGPPGRIALTPASWLEAAGLYLEARLRGRRFEERRRAALAEVRRRLRRLAQLEAHLARDLAGLGDAGQMRREAEALLAFGQDPGAGRDEMDLPDPRHPDRRLTLALDPRLGLVANAGRRFDKARRAERARRQIEDRLRATRAAGAEARAREAATLCARELAELDAREPSAAAAGGGERGTLQYLTSSGLMLLVGRNARENHRLTFRVARPDDLWLHARDIKGAHVVLRDPEGRARAEDRREAAEVAAFFSAAHGAAKVDVHVALRKHLRPAKGAAGRVRVAHSETLRVTPRDPEGRLRRR
jgi:hypothetical protein